jgi:hypothetical protein
VSSAQNLIEKVLSRHRSTLEDSPFMSSIGSTSARVIPFRPRFGSDTTPPAGPSGSPDPIRSNEPPAGPTPAPKAKYKPFRSFAKGLVDPILSVGKFIINEPVKAGLYLGATLLAMQQLPILATGLAVGMCAFGGYQVVSGIGQLFSGLRKGDANKTNAAAEQLGRGVFDVAVTYSGAIKGVKALGSAVGLIRTTPNLTLTQKASILLQQTPKGTAAAELETLPKTIGAWATNLKNRFLSLFNKESYKISGNDKIQPLVENVAGKRDAVVGFLEKNQDIWGFKSLREFIGSNTLRGEQIKQSGGNFAAVAKNPETAAYLARAVATESKVQRGITLLEDLRTLVAGSDSTEPNPAAAPPPASA